jgi:hypothetical protein
VLPPDDEELLEGERLPADEALLETTLLEDALLSEIEEPLEVDAPLEVDVPLEVDALLELVVPTDTELLDAGSPSPPPPQAESASSVTDVAVERMSVLRGIMRDLYRQRCCQPSCRDSTTGVWARWTIWPAFNRTPASPDAP